MSAPAHTALSAHRPHLPPGSLIRKTVVAFFGFLVAAWIWVCLCEYLPNEWNAVRLTPTFMWWHGGNPYPGPGEGPVTTWIYGPTTLLFFSPAVLAQNTFNALFTAAWLNLALVIVPLGVLMRVLSKPGEDLCSTWAFMLTLAMWPACNLVFEQADNTAIAAGLLSLALLSGPRAPGRRELWMLAAAGALALWSKPTEVGPVLGQFAWLALRHGRTAALRQIMRIAVAGGIAGIAFIATFGAEGLVYNTFVVPSRIPWDGSWLKAIAPIYLPYVALYVILPVCLLLARWRQLLFAETPVQAGCWYFILSLPFNIAGFATIGGNINSLHGCVYMLPGLALAAARHRTWLPPAAITLALALQILPYTDKPARLSSVQQSMNQAEQLAKACRGQIYFPWNPLITFYSEQRFDHTEDGLLTRALTGEEISSEKLHAGLPPHLGYIAYQSGIRHSYFEERMPRTRAIYYFGGWTLVSADGLLPPEFTTFHDAVSSSHKP